MKKRALFFTFSTVVVVLFYSCKKETNPADKPDSWYRAQLESAVDLHKELPSGQKVTTISNVNFATYKEAYETFAVQPMDMESEGSTVLDEENEGDSYVITYICHAVLSIPVKSSLDPGAIGLNFPVQYSIIYPAGENPQVMQNDPITPVIVSYSGFGTISNPSGKPTVFITPNGPVANAGVISGTVQVVGSISGNPFSILITITGTYSYNIPSSPGGSSIITFISSASGTF